MVGPSWTRGEDQAVDIWQNELAELLPGLFSAGQTRKPMDSPPGKMIMLDHHHLAQHLCIGVQLCQQRKEIVGVCPCQLNGPGAEGQTYMNRSSPESLSCPAEACPAAP